MTHPEMVAALMKRGEELDPSPYELELVHCSMGLLGEAGEVAEHIKKKVFHGRVVDPVKITDELGDLYFYLEALHARLGITREECLEANMIKLGKRYPGYVYTDALSHSRADVQA